MTLGVDACVTHERILDGLVPDEARILLLLLEGGPQPSVDVRTGGPVGLVSSHLVAPGLQHPPDALRGGLLRDLPDRRGARHVGFPEHAVPPESDAAEPPSAT